MTKSERTFMDYAASTSVDEEVLSAMLPYFSETFGNPSSLHHEGKMAAAAVREAREAVAKELNCESSEIVFTASGTESNNIAILGTYEKARKEGVREPHFITTNIEHSSVEKVFEYLEKAQGAKVDFIPVYSDGIVDPRDIKNKINENTILVSVMYVNNEVGTVEPVREIGKMIAEINKERSRKIVFHVDAAQAPLYFPIDVSLLEVDLFSIDAQKIYGPKGVGLLFTRKGCEPLPIMFGGAQEHGLRPGTENVPNIVGLAKALLLAGERREEEGARLRELQEYFFEKIDAELPEVNINGSREKRSPNNVNISVKSMDGDFLAMLLSEMGVAVSAASACQTGKGLGSKVVRALVLAAGGGGSANAVRFTMGRRTSKEDVLKAVGSLKEILKK